MFDAVHMPFEVRIYLFLSGAGAFLDIRNKARADYDVSFSLCAFKFGMPCGILDGLCVVWCSGA